MTTDPRRRRRIAASYGLSIVIHALAFLLVIWLAVDGSVGGVKTVETLGDVSLVHEERAVFAAPLPSPASAMPTAAAAPAPARPSAVVARPVVPKVPARIVSSAAAAHVPTTRRGAPPPRAASRRPELAHNVPGAPPASDGTPFPLPATPVPRLVEIASPAPTVAPTVVPRIAPAATSVALATAAASVAPTEAPTIEASRVAAVAITPAPTLAPTIAPTLAPTAAPTQPPTAPPTRAPTVPPTLAPIAAPATLAPTAAPTAAPSRLPTAAPTRFPTAVPATALPTTAATVSPNRVPIAAPSPLTAVAAATPPPSPASRPVALQTAAPAPSAAAAPHAGSSPAAAPASAQSGAGRSPASAGRSQSASASAGASGAPSTPRNAGANAGAPAPGASSAGRNLDALNDRLKALSAGGDVDYRPTRVAMGDAQSIMDRAMEAYEAGLAPSADILRRTFGLMYERRTAGHPDSVAYVFDTYTIGPIRMCKAWKIVEHPAFAAAREIGPVAGSAGIGGGVVTNANSPVVRHDNGGLAEASIVQFPCSARSYTAVPVGSITTPVPRHPDAAAAPLPQASLAPRP